jgi:hypothetical protein
MPTFHSGSDGRAFDTPQSGSAPTSSEIQVNKWEITIDGDTKKFDNNRDGRWRQAGNVDVEGTLNLHWDSNSRISSFNTTGTLPDIRHGTILSLQLQEDGTTTAVNSFRFLAIVDKFKFSSDFDDELDCEVSVMLQSGTVKYPGDT